MNILNDLSANTGVISFVIAGTGWAVKKALQVSFNLLIGYIKQLLEQIQDAKTKVATLDSKMGELSHTISDFNKMKIDLNGYYARLKDLEDKFNKK